MDMRQLINPDKNELRRETMLFLVSHSNCYGYIQVEETYIKDQLQGKIVRIKSDKDVDQKQIIPAEIQIGENITENIQYSSKSLSEL